MIKKKELIKVKKERRKKEIKNKEKSRKKRNMIIKKSKIYGIMKLDHREQPHCSGVPLLLIVVLLN